MAALDSATKLQLVRFACAFAWADLSVHPAERAEILALMERLHIDQPAERQAVIRWLKSPPDADELDPLEIPHEHRELFVRECEEIIRADGVIKPEEIDAIQTLRKVLFGDKRGESAMTKAQAARDRVIEQLNRILQLELAGVTRYLHYSFLVFGPGRIPIVSFFREQAQEGMQHAILMGEKITALGGHPTIVVESPPEPPKHDTRTLLAESVEFEKRGLAEYRKLLALCGDDVALEELVRGQIRAEAEHVEEVEKMLRSAEK
jgi:bacterioferritin